MDGCTILWCGKYEQNWENEPHSHNYFQMVGILRGGGTVYVNDTAYAIRPERVFLFRPQKTHAILCGEKGQERPTLLDVKFTLNDPQLAEDLAGLGATFRPKDFAWFARCFDRIIEESAQQRPYYYAMVNGYLFQMLVRMARERLGQPDVPPEVEPVHVASLKGVDVNALMQYIQSNYSRPITLEALSAFAGVNKTTLIDIFREVCGAPPIRYINRVRLNKAKELLANTDAGVGEIGELGGLQSVHYFSRVFKAKEGVTTMEYRARNLKSRYFTYPGRGAQL